MSTAINVKSENKSRQEIFSKLWEECQPLATSLAFRRANYDRNKAHEMLQEGLLVAWENFDTFELGTNFSAWFVTLMRNRHTNKWRRAQHFNEIREFNTHDLEMLTLSDEPETPERLCQLSQGFDERIQEVLDKLSEKNKNILLLREIKDFSYSEIADELNIPIGTVMSSLARSRRKVKKGIEIRLNDHELPRGYQKEFQASGAHKNVR